ASSMYGNSSRLTRNPGLSATTTGTLPSLRTSSTSVATVSSSVARPRTTSTRCIRWTGFKKCSPATRPGCGAASAIRDTDNADEFLVDVLQHDRDAVDGEELRDARAHHPGAEHRDSPHGPRADVVGHPRRSLPRPLALQEHLDQVAGGGREHDAGELLALGGE